MLLNCKFCGGELEITDGASITTCKYCRTAQTLPKIMDEESQNRFNRANALRRRCDFDKAEAAFEKIIEAEGTEAEAYWGLVLSKYGIEYVEDPASGKMLPTCHRASFDSVIADEDYKSALEYADKERHALYEAQAREIDRIQKEILSLAQKEESYDVFICYKETDENGKRTRDSVIADEIYYELTDAGFKVFFAAKTLENKLGSEYEPIIFAALNSAKVMLVIGTREEYFNAVWVKNEWSRYLKIMKKDRKKRLIPCYRDMDAYDLPEEFAHIQAQNMERIAFVNDLTNGVKKIMEGFKKKPDVIVKEKETVLKETVVKEPVIKEKTVIKEMSDEGFVSAALNVDALLRRVFIFLEDGDFDSANQYCEKVLDVDPENGRAYLGKLMAELMVNNMEELEDYEEPFDDKNTYKKILRYADDGLKKKLESYIKNIKDNRNEELYKDACSRLSWAQANSVKDVYVYMKASNTFKSIPGWKDSDEKALVCQEIIKEIESKEEAMKRKRIKIVTAILIIFPLMLIIFGLIGARHRHDLVFYPMVEATCTNRGNIAYYHCKGCGKNFIDKSADSEVTYGVDVYKVVCKYVNCVCKWCGDTKHNWKNGKCTVCHKELNTGTSTETKEQSQGLKYSLSSDEMYYTVTGIGNCKDTDIIIPSTYEGKAVKAIGYQAFSGCLGITSITIPDSVVKIGSYAFSGCNGIKSITIGSGVTMIDTYAFTGCTGLTSIKYCGTQTQWNSITKQYSWNYSTGNYTITYDYTGE